MDADYLPSGQAVSPIIAPGPKRLAHALFRAGLARKSAICRDATRIAAAAMWPQAEPFVQREYRSAPHGRKSQQLHLAAHRCGAP